MCLQDFMKNMSVEIKKRLGDEYRVGTRDILKNNSVTGHAVTIRREDEGIAPCIYIDSIYDRYLKGDIDISSAAGEVIRSYREHDVDPGMDMPSFTDPGDIITKVRGKLINTAMNRQLLEDIPHRGFLDLALVYTVVLPRYQGMAGEILIHDEHLSIWGIDEADLYSAVCRDMQKPDGVVFEKMDAILGPWMGEDAGMEAARCPMYVLTNKSYRNGAVQILNKNALDSATGHIGSDSIIILPSSIHELIMLPADRGDEDPDYARELADIVRIVNDTDVLEQEILSYHVYHYSRETGEVTIAA